MIKVYPSILSADFSKLDSEIKMLEEAGADGVHVDVMDGHFVNNITIGAPVVKSIRKCSNIFFDVHLMIENPEKYIESFINAGADVVTIHVETTNTLKETIEKIKSYGVKAGISIKPATDIPDIEILKMIDILLVMSVEPGFGGQKYIESTTEKLRKIKEIKEKNKLSFEVEIDGGINFENVGITVANGVNIVVAGSAVFGAENKEEAILKLKSEK